MVYRKSIRTRSYREVGFREKGSGFGVGGFW